MGVGEGLYMYVVVVQKFTFAISSPDEFLSVGVSRGDGECASCRESQGSGSESERQSTEDCRRDFGQ